MRFGSRTLALLLPTRRSLFDPRLFGSWVAWTRNWHFQRPLSRRTVIILSRQFDRNRYLRCVSGIGLPALGGVVVKQLVSLRVLSQLELVT